MQFIQIRSFDNYIEANMVMGLLQENGINCHLKDEHTITIDPLLSPAIGGMKLMVYGSQAARANEILAEAEGEYVKTIACTKCSEKKLVVKEVTVKPKNIWAALKSLLLIGQSTEHIKYYACENCGTVYKELPQAGN
jgi:DNA-directed RNA polymerase subunit RPC12/RpoP